MNGRDNETRDLLLARLEEYRFFPLKDKTDDKGDRFLMPWIYSHIYGTGKQSRSALKRAAKEISSFFEQKELVKLSMEAGELWPELMQEQLSDSALRYIKISKSDPSFARKYFGLARMTEEETDNKIFHDVYSGMITLLLRLSDFPYREMMIRALDESFLTAYPERQDAVDQWLESLPDQTMREIFHH